MKLEEGLYTRKVLGGASLMFMVFLGYIATLEGKTPVESNQEGSEKFIPYQSTANTANNEIKHAAATITRNVEVALSEVQEETDDSYHYRGIDVDSYLFKEWKRSLAPTSMHYIDKSDYLTKEICFSLDKRYSNNFKKLEFVIQNGYMPEYKHLLNQSFKIKYSNGQCQIPSNELQELFQNSLVSESSEELGEDIDRDRDMLEEKIKGFRENLIERESILDEEDILDQKLNSTNELNPDYRCVQFKTMEDVFKCRARYIDLMLSLKSKLKDYSDEEDDTYFYKQIESKQELTSKVIEFLSLIISDNNDDYLYVKNRYLEIHKEHYSK